MSAPVDVLAAWDRQIEWLRDLVATNPGSERHREELGEAIQARAAVEKLIDACRPAITDEGMDDNELQRLRDAFAGVGAVA